MQLRLPFFLFLLIGVLLSCGTSQPTQPAPTPEPCPDDIACTEEYKAITIQVQDEQGSPVELDALTILNQTDDNNIEINQAEWYTGMAQDRGRYVILTDASQKILENRRVIVVVTGKKEEQQILSSTFVLGADCCHVQHYEGELLITIN